MATNKKFFWLKLKEDFFRDKKIKKLRKMENGDSIILIYLKLMLNSLENNGNIFIEGLEDTIEEELSLVLDEDVNLIKILLEFLKKYNLLEIKNNNIYLPKIQELTGKETAEAIKKRRQRQQKKGDNVPTMSRQCPDNVRQCPPEIEKEIEIDKEIEKKKNKKKKKVVKVKYAEFVQMTKTEYETLTKKYGGEKTKKLVEILNNYKGSVGKKYKSDYRAILSWVISRYDKDNKQQYKKTGLTYDNPINNNPF